MKSKLKKVAWVVGLLVAGVCIAFVFVYSEALTIRCDLHLGLSPCTVAAPAASPQTVRVAIAAVSDTTKRALRARYSWHQATSGGWDSAIPWFSDLVVSTEFEPVLRHARGAGRSGIDGKLQTHYDTPQWSYDLTLDDDRNILWIVRDIHSVHPVATK